MGLIRARLGLRRPSLYANVIAAVFLSCALLVGSEIWHVWQGRAARVAEAEVRTANLARSLAQQAHDTIQLADTVLLGLRERAELDGLGPDSLARLHRVMVAYLAELPVVHGLFLFNADGIAQVNSLTARPAPLDYSDRGYFQYHRTHTDRGIHISRPVHSKTDGSWIVVVSRRLDTPDGRFAGVVLATISVEFLERYYASFDMGRQGAIDLITTGGTIIARAPVIGGARGEELTGRRIDLPTLRLPAGNFWSVSPLDGVTRLGSYRVVRNYPLAVIVAYSYDEILAPWRNDATLHIGVSVGLALALGLLGLYLARQIREQQQAERRYRLLAENSSDAITCIRLGGRRLYVSPAFTTLTGWSSEECLGQNYLSFIHPDDRTRVREDAARLRAEGQWVHRFRYIRKDGSPLWVEARARVVPASLQEDAYLVANVRDISRDKAAEEQLAELNRELAAQASTDGLTGLANRRRFDEALAQEWRRAAREEQPLALLLIDVDRFKPYNDHYGHLRGDHCLRSIADAIVASVRRSGDLVARYGGEELAVLLPATGAVGAADMAERVRAAVEAIGLEHATNPPWGVVTASLGAAAVEPYPGSASECGELVAAADTALYEAKRMGRNRAVSWTTELVPTAPASPPGLAGLARWRASFT